MALLDEIAVKLQALSVGTVGVDLFKGVMPETPDACTAVFEYGGRMPTFGFGTAGVDYESPSVQVLCRGVKDDYQTPRDLAETAYQGLAAVEAETLTSDSTGTSAFYHWIHPIQCPFCLDRDANGRVLFAFNCAIDKEPSTT